MTYNQYDLANTSLVKTGILTEQYIPLWVYSSSKSAGMPSGGNYYMAKGSTQLVNVLNGGTAPSNVKLHTLNSSWSPNQKFALEASIYCDTAGITAYAVLYDATTTITSAVSGASVSTTSQTFTVVRSGSFTLTPGHSYALAIYSSGSGDAYLTKASLIAFLQ